MEVAILTCRYKDKTISFKECQWGGMNENETSSLISLNTWSQGFGTVEKGLGGGTLLEEARYWQ